MSELATMSVTDAASKALELIAYGQWDNQAGHSWRSAREGTFEEFAITNYLNEDDEVYDEVKGEYVPVTELSTFDTDYIWQEFHGEGGKGTRDGWTAEVVTSYGGEGDGDQYWMVISITDSITTRFFRKDGWYASYDGGYLDGETYEVQPKEKLVTFYEQDIEWLCGGNVSALMATQAGNFAFSAKGRALRSLEILIIMC